MSRLAGCFDALRKQNQTALISFITAGDPALSYTVAALHALVEGGVDILELGIPFSDPEADGPSIQRSSERALRQGVSLRNVLAQVKEFRESNQHTPLVLMGYLNTVLAMGEAEFAQAASSAGVDGLIMVNLPPEEADTMLDCATRNDIDVIFLIAPTTAQQRVEKIVEKARGFIYYVSLKGITGASHLDTGDAENHVNLLRRSTQLPIVVGFGIKSPEQASSISRFADGIVIGSKLVDTMANIDSQHEIELALSQEAQRFREALND